MPYVYDFDALYDYDLSYDGWPLYDLILIHISEPTRPY